MSEEKNTVELNNEELEKVVGGFGPTPTLPPTSFPEQSEQSEYSHYCPYCKNGIIKHWESGGPSTVDGSRYCKHCDDWVTPVKK